MRARPDAVLRSGAICALKLCRKEPCWAGKAWLRDDAGHRKVSTTAVQSAGGPLLHHPGKLCMIDLLSFQNSHRLSIDHNPM